VNRKKDALNVSMLQYHNPTDLVSKKNHIVPKGGKSRCDPGLLLGLSVE